MGHAFVYTTHGFLGLAVMGVWGCSITEGEIEYYVVEVMDDAVGRGWVGLIRYSGSSCLIEGG